MSTRRQDRKAVRKANRIAAIDQEKPKRNFRKVVVIIVAAIFVVVESFLLLSSKVHYDYDESVKVAEEMTIQLSMINTSLQTGNKALFEESLTNFREQLNLFEENEYVKKNASDLLGRLQKYSATFTDDAALVNQIMEIRVATNSISATATEAKDTQVDAVKVYAIRDDYTALRGGLESINAPELKGIKEKLISLSDEIIKFTDSAAVCVSICAENTLNDKQDGIKDIIGRYEADLAKESKEKSEKYSPNQLILDLGEYSEL